MPIKDKSLYPPNWKRIRAQILERAENSCELCGVENHKWIRRSKRNRAIYVPSLIHKGTAGSLGKAIRVVLTVAHLDHNPQNNHPDNLAALCQRCHLRHDRHQHAANSAATREAKRAPNQTRMQFNTEQAR